VIFYQTVNGTYSAEMTGSGSLRKDGTDKLTLTGNNTYTGGTIIGAGTLSLGSSGAIGSGGTITFITGTLQFTATNTTDYSSRLSSAGHQVYNIDTNGQSVTFASALTSTGGRLTKSGAGTLTLGGANTYDGGTTVSGGTLTASGAAATLGLGNVTVQGTTAGTSLVIQSGVADAISDTATLNLAGGGTAGIADQGYANLGDGVVETVGTLLLGGVPQLPGFTYGSSSSGAASHNDEYFSGMGVVSVGTPGDFNGDGSTDAADFVIWRKGLGTTYTQSDYELWRSHFGQTAGRSSSINASAVPEPATLILFLASSLSSLSRRRVAIRNCFRN
jgi:fibronectin-binding autotransporter adhesin